MFREGNVMGKYKGWILLIIAIIFEVIATTNVKLADGFTNTWPTVFVFLGLLGAIYFLSKSFIYIPLAVAYAVWVGVGTSGVALIGLFAFDETFGLSRIIGLVLVIIGVSAITLFLNEKDESGSKSLGKEF
ncbi:multidrug efflux SMR transporter [Salicibibacter halophilus]|uniref:Multidrug efflux SMR transporter n=2 Tax=Salicibibacter halophilus TaxID=2502791 RepID=A0A514LKJ2_9BACI|nr:multidrug efflux SMR transporter [Salicibibacter halophilus]